MNRKRSDGLPPNFDDLPAAMQRIIEEELYQKQLRWSHGCCPGDRRLKTMSADGEVLPIGFGAAVDVKAVEEVDEREDRDSID